MKAEKLAGLKPENVFAYFEKICSIPHGSNNTKQISDYLVSFAEEHGLRCIRDSINNVIMFKPASPGFEDREPVILQGHMDMVCQKDDGVAIDMEKEPVDVTHNGEFVYARGTTLGADNGIGVALCLAILADNAIAHPPLEVIFTTDEEIGLVGANAIDLSMLKGRRMMNLDTPYDNVFNVGCGGGARVTMELPCNRTLYTGNCLRITIDGLHGGHSGSQIGMGYANANKVMADLLSQLGPVRLVSLAGGAAGNVIPSFCQAVIALEGIDPEIAGDICRHFEADLRKNYAEPTAVVITALTQPQASEALDTESTQRVIEVIRQIPNEVQQWSPDFKKLPLLSLNLGVVELKENLHLLTAVRSGVNSRKQDMQEQLRAFAAEHGCIYGESGIYSAWEYRKDSPLRDTLVRLFEQTRGESPIVRVVHAGLECGVLGEKIPGLDCVSMGPNAMEIHTSRERLEIASAERTWNFLLEILKTL